MSSLQCEQGWMDQLRVSPASQPPSSFLTTEDLYELLQGRFSGTGASTTTSSTDFDIIPTRPNSTYEQSSRGTNTLNNLSTSDNDILAAAPSTLKMEPEISDFLSSSSYNWVPTPQLYNDSLSCLTYSNHLPQPAIPDAHFGYTSTAAASSGPTSPQIQALRDFMVYGNLASPQTAPSPHGPLSSAVSSRTTTPAATAGSLFYHTLDETTDSLLVGGGTGGRIGCSPSSKQADMSLAYRALCTEIYATERSPHRSQFQRENHILAERQRREEMNEKFSALRAMIPKATKKDKASIVGDTIDYVLELEKRLKQLQACKDTTAAGAFFKSLKRKTPPVTSYGRCDGDTDTSITAAITGGDHESLATRGTSNKAPGGAPSSDDNSIQPVLRRSSSSLSPVREGHSAVNSPADEITEEKLKPKVRSTVEVDVQNLGSQAVIKIVCAQRTGHVLRVLNALEECKVDVLQSNVTTVGNNSIHFVTVELEEGVSGTTEDLIAAVSQAACYELGRTE